MSWSESTKVLSKAVTIKDFQFPPCAQSTVTHACGTVAAALCARTISKSIDHLIDLLLHRQKEMQEREEVYTVDVLKKHLKRLRKIQAFFTGIINRYNHIIDCYCQLNNATDIHNKLNYISERLDDDIIQRLEDLDKKITDNNNSNQQNKWENRIYDLIRTEIPNILTGLTQQLREAKKLAEKLLTCYDNGWDHNVLDLWQDPLCKSIPEPTPK